MQHGKRGGTLTTSDRAQPACPRQSHPHFAALPASERAARF